MHGRMHLNISQQPPYNLSNKSMQNQIEIIAILMGERAVKIYQDIKKFKETKKDDDLYKFPTLKYKTIPTQSNVCAKILQRKAKGIFSNQCTAFKCHDCIFESNSIMCVDCFQKSDHQGHIYEVIEVFGGCCDCGDQQKWNPTGFCKNHNNNNIVEEMKLKVNPEEEQMFIYQLKFCFAYWFMLYNEAEIYKKKGIMATNEGYESLMKQGECFGVALLEYLSEFNMNSLISNIMTFNLLCSKIQLKQFNLQFCPNASTHSLLQILFRQIKYAKCSQIAVNLFTQMFALRQFRRILTITFINLHNDSSQFVMSQFNHLSCQLLTSHKMISELVELKAIKPLTFRPKKKSFKSFDQMARYVVRYYIDVDYLSKLYKDASQKYITYHIMQGQLSSIGYYKTLSYYYQQSINFYGIEQIGLLKIMRLTKIIKNSPQSLTVLQKGIKDMWSQIWQLYTKWNKDLFNDKKFQQMQVKYIYLTYELSLAILVFTYFQKLDENQSLSEQSKIIKLIELLGLSYDKKSIRKLVQVLEIVNSNLILAGLTLGHPETMDRYFTFFSFTFKKTFATISLTFYLYKILIKMIDQINKSSDKLSVAYHPENIISTQFVFKRPLQTVIAMFKSKNYLDDDQSIFDHKKNLIRLAYFLHLLIQAAQTDIHQMLLASGMGFGKKEKYDKMLNKFYIEVLKNYNKISLKAFKEITDAFIFNNQAFQKFVSTSKDIEVQHGKISLKNLYDDKQIFEKQKQKQTDAKIESQLNLFYFKTFRTKLTNINENQVVFKVPTSENHFLHKILSQEFVDELLQILSSHIDIIVINNGKIKEGETASLGLLVVQMIKIGKAFKHKPNSKVSLKISQFFKSLQHKKTFLQIFTQNIIKLICFQSQQINDNANESIKTLNKQSQFKAYQRKRKLQNKKNKMLAKYKENQQKFQDQYANELNRIRDQMQEENQMQVQCQSENSKICIICRQNDQKSTFHTDLMLMGFMQLTDLYQHYLKGKQPSQPNCHLVFKTCGHYIHQACHLKTAKSHNQQYSICQLCKASHNCLFPVSVAQYKDSLGGDMDVEKVEMSIYQQLKKSYSLFYAMDDGLRDLCGNGFGQEVADDREIKDKLMESTVVEIIFSAIVNQQANSDFFSKKQLEIYQNILYGLKIFQKGEIQQNRHNIKQESNTKEKQQKKKETQQFQKLTRKLTHQKNQHKKKTIQTVYFMERYLTNRINSFIDDITQPQKDTKTMLSEQCIMILNQAFNSLIGVGVEETSKKESMQSEMKKQIEFDFNKCPEIKLLRDQIHLYSPPESLSKLIEMRGKCPNCQRYTNFINICLICEWKGCKGCQKESLSKHTQNMHCGNSIFLDTDAGNVYFINKKRFWQYPSMYQDYLGEHFKAYQQGVKLQKYKLNEHRYTKIKKSIVEYNIETTIRYEQFSKKRHFTGIL